MKEEIEIKIKTDLVFEGNSEYLPSIMEQEFVTKDELKRYGEYITVNDVDCTFYGDSEAIRIKEMRELLDEAEEAGANFVSIDYHCDHYEYEVYGHKVTRLEPEEVLDIKKQKIAIKKKKNEERIADLQATIDRIINENLKLDK